jgi:hypothetical protein
MRDPLLGKVRDRVIGPGRAELAAAMGTTSVVMGLVLGQDRPQVPSAEDEHPVGDLCPGGEHEPFRVAFARGLRGGIFTASMPASARTASDAPVNCPARSRTRNRESAARSPRSIKRLRTCCTVHGPSGLAVTPRMCTYREPTSITKKQYGRFRVTAQSTWKKSTASIVAACACRNFRQVVSVRRCGAGGIFTALRIRRMVVALTRWPTFSSSPWILL